MPGDYVYQRTDPVNTLDVNTKPTILRVKEVTPAGVLKLQGRCGTIVSSHVDNVVPCHMPILDPRVNPRLAIPSADHPCQRCHSPDRAADMLLCDGCGDGWHFDCLPVPLPGIPEGDWYCPKCKAPDVPLPYEVRPEPEAPLFLRAPQRRIDERNRQFHGLTVVAQTRDGPVAGLVSYLGHAKSPLCFEVVWEDGDVSHYSYTSLSRHFPDLLQAHHAASAVVAPAYPECFDYSSPSGLMSVLQFLMPGDWSPSWVSRLFNSLPSQGNFLQREGMRQRNTTPGRPERIPTLAAKIEPLLQLFSFAPGITVFDPWGGSRSISSVFATHGVRVLSNDIDPECDTEYHGNALQPELYRRVQAEHGSLDVIVMSPWFRLLDIALPLAVISTSVAVMCHVPGHYLSDSHPARVRLFSEWRTAGRLHVLLGLPTSLMGRRCAWLVVFRDESARDQLLRRLPLPPGFLWL